MSGGAATLRVSLLILTVLCLAAPRSSAHAADAVVAVAVPANAAVVTGAAIRLITGDLAQRTPPGTPAVRFDIHEDPCERSKSAALARSIAAGDAVAVIGHTCAAGASAAVPVYRLAGKPLIVAGASNGGGSLPAGPLYLPGVVETQGQFLGRELARIAGAEARIAVVSDRTRWALTNVREASATLQALGKAPVRAETFAGGDKDFAGLAARLAAAGITHVVLAAFASEAGLFVADLVKALPAVSIIGTETLAGPEFVRSAGTAAANVMIAVKPGLDAMKTARPGARLLIERLEMDRLRPTRADVAVAAAVEMVATVVSTVAQRGIKVTPGAVDEALRRASPAFETVFGPVVFAKNGHASVAQWQLHRWAEGRLTLVQN